LQTSWAFLELSKGLLVFYYAFKLANLWEENIILAENCKRTTPFFSKSTARWNITGLYSLDDSTGADLSGWQRGKYTCSPVIFVFW
jgi:hypothetical protein